MNIVKGTHDIYGKECRGYTHIENLLRMVAESYAFQEIRTPILEYTELFERGVGESSDIVRKEMYTFTDKASRSVTLRPEGTAGVMRSIVSEKLYATSDLPLKQYYLGPMFRYERPQAGRYRQFHQFGVESVGVTSPYQDAEIILLGYQALKTLGFQNVTLKINTLGDEKTRDNYRNALKEYFSSHIEHMCPDCQARFQSNPLRILDCKVEEDQEIARHAPKISNYLTDEAKSRFEEVLAVLDSFEIPYEIDEGLVRGLDYYSHVIFEFTYTTASGMNLGAIGAGGHYDKLLEEVGGPSLPGVGMAFGIERLYSVLKEDHLLEEMPPILDAYIMPIGEEQIKDCFYLASTLRQDGFFVEVCLEHKSFKNLFKRAENAGAKYALIVGEEELKNETVVLKNLKTKEQQVVSQEELEDVLYQLLEVEGESDDGTDNI